MAEFHILELKGEKMAFREVEGEAVEIGTGIQAFFIRPPSGEWHCLYDIESGARITGIYDTDAEAIADAESWLEEHGAERYRQAQLHRMMTYGRPPRLGNPDHSGATSFGGDRSVR